MELLFPDNNIAYWVDVCLGIPTAIAFMALAGWG